MKIVFDNDATVTNYEKFIHRHAVPYFHNKLGFDIVNPNALEIKDIFNLSDYLSDIQIGQIMNSFWVSFRFVQYTLFSRFRPGAAAIIRRFIRQRHIVEIHTSREKTCEHSIIGFFARLCTIGQYWINGVFLSPSKFHFYKNDDEKLQGVLATKPTLVFEDKPLLINRLADCGCNVLCVSGRHNQSISDARHIACLNSFQEQYAIEQIDRLLGKHFINSANQAAASDSFYRKLLCLRTIVNLTFSPTILNQENILHTDASIIYVSNHRSTLDPIILTSILKEPIHWVALKRFFMAEDSIFNNSKNPMLCKITAWMFRKLAFFPIERKYDNPNANNFNSIRAMKNFLLCGHKVGIFPEGTTRRPENEDFGEFDSSFLALAHMTAAYIQPITVLWTKQNHRKRIAINIGKAFMVDGNNYSENLHDFISVQKAMLEELKAAI